MDIDGQCDGQCGAIVPILDYIHHIKIMGWRRGSWGIRKKVLPRKEGRGGEGNWTGVSEGMSGWERK